MKTSEFIREALKFKDIGEHKRENGVIRFYDNQASLIATVSENEPMQMNTDFLRFGYMKKYSKLEFLALLYEYAKTPLEEREEEPKYRLRHKWLCLYKFGDEKAFLNYCVENKNVFNSTEKLVEDEVLTSGTKREWEQRTGRTWEQLMNEFDAEEEE